MSYKILDERGATLHTETNVALAIVWLENNSDIGVSIEPRPSDEELANYEFALSHLAAERATTLSNSVASTTPTTAPEPTKLLSATEAREAIKRKNEALYDKQIIKLVDKLIAGDGEHTCIEQNRYIVAKLTELGYYVTKSKNGHRISVNELVTVPTQSTDKAKQETTELLNQMQQTKLHKDRQY